MARTVFVVGAGASTEFGPMPVGAQLARDIEILMAHEMDSGARLPDGPISSAIMSSGGLADQHVRAMIRIRDGIQSCNSVDEFIDEWSDVPELGKIAKLAIACCILRSERECSLFHISNDMTGAASGLRRLRSSWLAIALSRLNPDARRRDLASVFNGVSFVTFNYDRCIEQYLLASFTSTFGLSQEEAHNILDEIPIFHAYGSLGPLPQGAQPGIDFGGPDFYIARAANYIRTFTEDVNINRRTYIQELIREADKVVFLGCAFHNQNLNILFQGSGYPAACWGTCYQMRARSVERARAALRFSSVELDPVEARGLLSKYAEDIFEA